MKRNQGASRLELLAAITLIAILSAILLDRFLFYQEAAEKAKVEYTIAILKSALRLQMATMLAEGRTGGYALLALQNPMDWLDERSDDPMYSSVADGLTSAKKISDQWQFDSDSGSLTYWPVHDMHLRPDASGQKRIRVHVKAVHSSTEPVAAGVDTSAQAATEEVVSVRLEVESYHWF